METVTKAFLIDGKVQRAGFRSKIKTVAKSHRLRGFAENLDNYEESVLVYCEGRPQDIESFEKEITSLITNIKSFLKEKEKTEIELNKINDALDKTLTTGKPSERKEKALPLLERKKSILRKIKEHETRQTAYHVEKITITNKPEEYSENVGKPDYKDNFKLIRDPEETSARLDEGINALIDLKTATSTTNYELIDTDFAILDVKYGSLNESIKNGFQTFPTNFAKAFGIVLDQKYNLKPTKTK